MENNICQYLSIKDVVDVFNWLYPPIGFLVGMLEPIPDNIEQELWFNPEDILLGKFINMLHHPGFVCGSWLNKT